MGLPLLNCHGKYPSRLFLLHAVHVVCLNDLKSNGGGGFSTIWIMMHLHSGYNNEDYMVPFDQEHLTQEFFRNSRKLRAILSSHWHHDISVQMWCHHHTEIHREETLLCNYISNFADISVWKPWCQWYDLLRRCSRNHLAQGQWCNTKRYE